MRGLVTHSFVARWQRQLFPDRLQGSLSALLLLGMAWAVWRVLDWGLLSAVFQPLAEACRDNVAAGACWGVLVEKHRILLFGRYPHAEQWRPALALLLILLGLVVSLHLRSPARLRWLGLGISLPLALLLLAGGVAGLTPVPGSLWGGLPLTVLLWLVGLAIAMPLGILAAVGRQSELPLLRTLCGLYVELVRGVPLVSLLFMAAFMLPLLLPQEARWSLLLRVEIVLGLFAGAYLAEVIRGGIQAVSPGQFAAAQSLGFSPSQTWRLIILPQALRHALPAMVNNSIGLFKETALVTIVGLHELTGGLSLAVGGDPLWRPFFLEAYLGVALIYGLCCFGMSCYCRQLERHLGSTATLPSRY